MARDQRTDLVSLAAEVRWYKATDGHATEGSGERKRTAEEEGCQAGSRYGDPRGGRQGKVIRPERRRRTGSTVRIRLRPERVSERRACRIVGQPCNTQRDQLHRAEDEAGLLHKIRLLARQRPRLGSGGISWLPMKRRWTVNEERLNRLWIRVHMQVPRTQQRKR